MKTTGRAPMPENTRGRILGLLRAKEQTVNDLAAALRLTDNAVRAHLVHLEHDGLIRQAGTQPGFRKPHVMYALTPEAEHVFPRAYGVLLDLLLIVVSKQLSPKEMRAAMREVGRRVADSHLLEAKGESRNQRIETALRILKDLGGSAAFEESEGKHFIRGNGCPLAAATARHPEACLIAETLLSRVIGVPVKERCIHGAVPFCRFEIR
ncbi:MAG TPA: helix-turn-helix domain-containing protein [Chthoniobacterales bacterium]|nr:helix-turn-helix domain-containing protein [Chthoniobacterales bacterium]